MISKRHKTLRKNQRKRSNHGRRLHRLKMRGGSIPINALRIELEGIRNDTTITDFKKVKKYQT